MNTGFKKTIALGLCAGLALTSLSGCSSKKKTFDGEATALTVNGESLSVGVINFGVRYSQSVYEDMYISFGLEDPFNYDMTGSGTTLGDNAVSSAVSLMTHAMLAEQKMEDYGVSLTDEDQELITAAAEAFIEENDEELLELMGATQEIVERYLELNMIQARVEAEMITDVDTEVSDEEAAQRRVEYVLIAMETEDEDAAETEDEAADETEAETDSEAADETGAGESEAAETEAETALESEEDSEAETAALTEEDAAKTQSADETDSEAADETEAETDSEAADETETETAAETEVETEEETEDEATRAAREKAYQKAVTMIELVQDGAEFEDAAAEIDEDLSVHEITFGSENTSYSENLINATEGLADDTLVDYPVEAETGYYVVHVISELDREATDDRKEEIVEERQDERIDELYEEWEEDSEISQDDDVLATIVFDYSLTQYVETETEAEVSSEAETDAGTGEDSEAESESAAETDSEAESESAAETDSEAESESAAETDIETEAETGTVSETESETVSETESEE